MKKQNNRYLFKNCKFKFEGLKPEIENGFIQIVKDLGGQVASNAPITFVDDEYFKKNSDRTDLYKLTFLWDSIGGSILDINSYRYNTNVTELKND